MKQQSFLPKLPTAHGGDLRKGRRKVARPFSHKNAIHVVLRSHRARGRWSMLARANQALVKRLLDASAKKHRIRVYRFVNVGNHLHLLIKTEARHYEGAKADFKRFLREFAGRVAFEVTGAKKGQAKGGFWEKLVYTRLVSWGREFAVLKSYFVKNFYEAIGLEATTPQWWRSILRSLEEAGVGPPVQI